MAYVRPEEVVSPKSRVRSVIEVIHDPGENGMSVARIVWDEKEVIATRWNGNSEQPLGNPVSRGHATWFVVDGYAATSVENAARSAAEDAPDSLVAQYRAMAADADRERDAEEWTEGLIESFSEAPIGEVAIGERPISKEVIGKETTGDASAQE